MKWAKINKSNKFYIILGIEVFTFLIILLYLIYNFTSKNYVMVMGGVFHNQGVFSNTTISKKEDTFDITKFFRPSTSEIINNKDLDYNFFDKFPDKNTTEIQLDKELLKTPEDTLINYYTLLKSASYYDENSKKYAGCGSIGTGTRPYFIGYNYLTEEYKSELSFKDFQDSFKNIHHISLIKLKEIPLTKDKETMKRYFVELETIEGSDKPMTNFGYYYGFIDLLVEDGAYKISSMDFYGEDFLCAPYHGWSWNGESVVNIKYGEWCKLIVGVPTTQVENYTKKISFKGTDGCEYMIEFITLTNNTDVEIAQYKKDFLGKYERVVIDPEKCLEKGTLSK